MKNGEKSTLTLLNILLLRDLYFLLKSIGESYITGTKLHTITCVLEVICQVNLS